MYQILLLREKAGQISDIKRGSVELTCGIKWNVDFNFLDNETKKRVWAEAKGVETERYLICKKLWTEFGPGILEIWKGNYMNPKLVDVIIPQNKERKKK